MRKAHKMCHFLQQLNVFQFHIYKKFDTVVLSLIFFLIMSSEIKLYSEIWGPDCTTPKISHCP